MKKLICSFLLFLSTPLFAQINPAMDARLQFVLDSVCGVYNIKGASAAVLIPNGGIWKGVYGISTNSQPITADMLFGMGSNTKTYVSTLLLKMQEDGLLDLDDTIGTWIQNEPNISGQITIRQCLNHTSGIYSYTSNPQLNADIISDFSAIWPPEQILPYINAPLFSPGTSWSYSNSNYLIAGLIIKQVYNQSLSSSLRNYLLQPHNFPNTSLFPEELPSAPMANIWTKNFMQPYQEDIITEYAYNHNANMSVAWAAGGMLTTAEENVMYFDKLMSGQIINSASLIQMKTFRVINSIKAYGLGLFRTKNFNGRVVYGHGGTNLGYINENIFDSINGACISVMTNQDSVSNSIILNKVILSLHKVTISNPLEVETQQATSFIRLYPNPASEALTIQIGNGTSSWVKIVDATGRTMLHEPVRDGLLSVDVGDYSPGIYFAFLQDEKNGRSSVQKIVIE